MLRHMRSFLVVIDQIDIMHVLVVEAEDDPMVARHPAAPKALQVATQCVEAETRQVNILWQFGNAEQAQDTLNLIHDVRPDPAAVAVEVQQLEALMSASHDHVPL